MSEKRPIIAVDCDDVLAHHVEAFLAWSNEKFNTEFTMEDYTDHWSDLWSVDQEETERRAILFHDERHHRMFKPREGAIDILVDLKKDYDLVIVTARRLSIVNDSKEWLTEHYPGVFSDVRFVPIWDKGNTLTKAAICHELGASYLIDDMVRHCNLAMDEGIKALLFGDYIWNRHEAVSDGVIRVSDWHEVKEFFDDERSR